MNQHFLYPASLFVSTEAYQVDTILGSCVAVTLHDPVLKIGGINHFMLPFWNGQGLASPKYGNIAIEKLIDQMLKHGSSINNLQAKIFGGGEVLSNKTNIFNIGANNILVAQKILKERKINVLNSDTGGKNGRKIRFLTHTGQVGLKTIPQTNYKETIKNAI